MFCPVCGHDNPEGSRFCEECGILLVTDAPATDKFEESQKAPNTMDNNNENKSNGDVVVKIPKIDTVKATGVVKKHRFIILPIVAIVVALIVFVSIGSSVSSPEKVAENFFKTVTENDYDAMYNYIAMPESDFVNKDTFKDHMSSYWGEEGNPFEGVENFNVTEDRDYDYYDDHGSNNRKDDTIKNYTISCVNKVTGDTRTYSVTLIKQDTKSWLFFDNYKVSAANNVVQNIRFSVTGDVIVSLDGIKLENDVVDEYGNNIYEIDAIFRGYHNYTFSSELYETYEGELYFDNSDDTINIQATSVMTLKPEIVDSLESKAYEDIKSLYKSAINGEAFSSLSIGYDNTYYDFADDYEAVVNKIKINADGEGLNSLSFTSGEIYTNYSGNGCSVSTNDAGNFVVSFKLNVSYDYSTSELDWWTDELKYEYHASEDTVYFDYTYVDGKWLLYNISDQLIYFYGIY